MSEDLYRTVTDYARSTPAWVHDFAEIGTDAGLLVFGVLFVVAWWRARPADGRGGGGAGGAGRGPPPRAARAPDPE
ncbi:hypothetical protein ACFV08_23770 [Streptomyces fradiae]|uniref:hypothetical protein n=1 Tax=Streptomyces fradiae TaxID=1906 RepID=UPI0036B02CF9